MIRMFMIDLWQAIYNYMIEMKVEFITLIEAENQAKKMYKLKEDGKEIVDYANYFVGGIKRKRTSKQSALLANKISKYNQAKKEENNDTVPFYNWLEQ
jgi:hypothetical protein